MLADARWLGIFRILLGAFLSLDLLRHWLGARDFFSNEGVLTNHFSLFSPLGRNVFSIYHAFSTLGQVHVAFSLTLLIFLTFLLGYKTRLFHILSFVCITSLDARNLMVENGGTIALNLLCFWTLFLPLGRRFSVDALLKSIKNETEQTSADLNRRPALPPVEVSSLACLALLLQWSVIYFFNAVHKTGKGWEDGSAIHWFLHQDRIVTAFGIWVRENVPFSVLQSFTYGTLVVEGLLAVLLLFPFQQVWSRRLAFLLAIGLHGGIAATARLGVFSYVMVVYFFWPLSAADLGWLRAALKRTTSARTLVFDEDCGICFQTCRILRRLDVLQQLTFVGNTEESDTLKHVRVELRERSLVVLTPDGHAYSHERALSETLRALPLGALGLAWLSRLPGISHALGSAYRLLAANRHRASAALGLGVCGAGGPKAAPAATPSPSESRSWRVTGLARELAVALALFAAGTQVLTDNAWANQRVKVTQPSALLSIIDTFRLYQGWRMFAPEPPYEDGLLVVDARTKDGRKVDPLTSQSPNFDPRTRTGWGHNHFWCDIHLKMYFKQYSAYRSQFKDYLLRWHERTGNPADQLVAFDVWWVHDQSPKPGSLEGTPEPPIKIVSFGKVKDSLATPWLAGAPPTQE